MWQSLSKSKLTKHSMMPTIWERYLKTNLATKRIRSPIRQSAPKSHLGKAPLYPGRGFIKNSSLTATMNRTTLQSQVQDGPGPGAEALWHLPAVTISKRLKREAELAGDVRC
jgi:hypothetical protein